MISEHTCCECLRVDASLTEVHEDGKRLLVQPSVQDVRHLVHSCGAHVHACTRGHHDARNGKSELTAANSRPSRGMATSSQQGHSSFTPKSHGSTHCREVPCSSSPLGPPWCCLPAGSGSLLSVTYGAMVRSPLVCQAQSQLCRPWAASRGFWPRRETHGEPILTFCARLWYRTHIMRWNLQ